MTPPPPPRDVLYVTRKFPPSVGGMETLAYNTVLALETRDEPSAAFALGRGNRNLVWWIPVTAARLLGDVVARRSASYLFGDALAWAALSWIPRLFGRPAFTMVCGLDVTYDNPLYRAIVLPALRRAPRVLAISRATLATAIEAGVRDERADVLTMGVVPSPIADGSDPAAGLAFRARHGIPAQARLLLTTGRLVPRKGVAWFVAEVLPHLDSDVHHLVIGAGEHEQTIRSAAATAGVGERVHLPGRVSEDDRRLATDQAEIFVQPNIAVPHDMEGFGLVVVEAAQAGLIPVAARLEGLQDAVRDGETGYLVESADADAWITRLRSLLADPALPDRAVEFARQAREEYSVRRMGVELDAHVREVQRLAQERRARR